jgi:hypothetical protein
MSLGCALASGTKLAHARTFELPLEREGYVLRPQEGRIINGLPQISREQLAAPTVAFDYVALMGPETLALFKADCTQGFQKVI